MARLSTVLVMVLLVSGSNSATTVLSITFPVVGISFCLIIVRVGNGNSVSTDIPGRTVVVADSRTGFPSVSVADGAAASIAECAISQALGNNALN